MQIRKIETPVADEDSRQGLLAAADGDVVAIGPETFISLPPVDGETVELSEKDKTFWSSVGAGRGRFQQLMQRRLPFVAVVNVGGELFQLDGAKRAEAWRAGLLAPPETLAATVHCRDTLKEARVLAGQYVKAELLEGSPEQIRNAFETHGLDVSSYRLKHGKFVAAVYLAFRGSFWNTPQHDYVAPIDLTAAIGVLKEEISSLDEIDCPNGVFPTGVLAMAFVGLATEPAAIDFIAKIARREGNMRDGLKDPVQGVLALTELCSYMGKAKAVEFQPELYKRSLRGLARWCEGDTGRNRYWAKDRLWVMDVAPWVERFRRAKKITNRIDL